MRRSASFCAPRVNLKSIEVDSVRRMYCAMPIQCLTYVGMKPNCYAIWGLRRARRWSLRELERRTGLSRGYLSRLERGQRGASPTTLQALADLYEVPQTDITKEDT